MTRNTTGDFFVILFLIWILKSSSSAIDSAYYGLSGILSSILVILLVPGAITELAQVFLLSKQYRIAEELNRLVLPIRRAEARIPLNYLTELLCMNLNQLFLCLKNQQRYAEALQFSEEEIRVAEKRFGSESIFLSGCYLNHCALLNLMGDMQAAEEIAQRALNTLDRQPDNSDKGRTIHLSAILTNLGLIFIDAGKTEKGSELLKRSLDLKETLYGKDSKKLQGAYLNQGYAYLNAKDYSAAENCLRRVLELGKTQQKQKPEIKAAALSNLGEVLRAKGDLEQAETVLKEALQIREKSLSKNHPHFGFSYNNFGKLYCDQGKFEESRQYFEKALKLRESLAPGHPDLAVTLRDYAALLRKTDSISKAEELEARANSINANKTISQSFLPVPGQTPLRDPVTTVLVRMIVVAGLTIILPISCLLAATPGLPEKIPAKLSSQQYLFLGIRYKGAGWIELARESLNKAIELDPEGQTGKQAAVFLKTQIPRYPITEDAQQLNIKGFNQNARGRKSEAIETFQKCILEYPQFEWPYSNLGSIYVESGDPTKGEELIQKALSINPNYVNAWIGLAKAKRKQNDIPGADECVNKALDCVRGNTLLEQMVKQMSKKQ